jgi:hypothetical protein
LTSNPFQNTLVFVFATGTPSGKSSAFEARMSLDLKAS